MKNFLNKINPDNYMPIDADSGTERYNDSVSLSSVLNRMIDECEEKILEVEIDGKRVRYDGMSTSDTIEEALEYYGKGFDYIGSSTKIYVNGVLNEFEKPAFFFKRK